jgi:hypothetical protein
MVRRGGSGEQVIAQTQIAQILGDHTVIAVSQLLRSDALGFGLNQNRRAVFIGTRHHEDVVALHAFVTRVDIRWDSETCDVPDMTWSVGVRPCDGNKDMTHNP